MNEFPFHTFINLVKFDQQLVKREQDALKKEEQLAAVEQQQIACQQQVEQAKAAEHTAQKLVDMYELDAKTLDARVQKIRYNLDNVANPKEYASLSKELAHAHAEQQELESSLLDAWQALEARRRDAQQAHVRTLEQSTHIAEQTKTLEHEMATDDAQIEALYAQRDAQLVGIPQEWLDKYEAMRNRIDNPVVPVQDKMCSGCSYVISEQDLARLAKRALIQCKHCFRFLYDQQFVQSVDAQ